MSPTPEIARSVRTGRFHSNVHDLGASKPGQALDVMDAMGVERAARFAQLLANFLDEADKTSP